jgi:hypothetical protein
MALPFAIYMQPPNILIQSSLSSCSLINANRIGTWGKVIQTNRQTLSYNVGNIVFYNEEDVSFLTYTPNVTTYGIIDETKILFVEAGLIKT